MDDQADSLWSDRLLLESVPSTPEALAEYVERRRQFWAKLDKLCKDLHESA